MIDYNALGQAIDTTWGRASTSNIATHSIKFSIQGDMLVAKYNSIVVFVSDRDMVQTKKNSSLECDGYLEATIKSIRDKYKQITGTSLKLKKESENDMVEFIGINPHNLRRPAYYRKFIYFSIS